MEMDTKKQMSDITIRSEYLYNNTGNHYKVYNLAIVMTDLNEYKLVAEYGARLGVLKQIEKWHGRGSYLADLRINALVEEKIAKGYTRVSTSPASWAPLNTGSSNNTSANKNHESLDKLKKQTAKKEQIPIKPIVEERRLDFDEI